MTAESCSGEEGEDDNDDGEQVLAHCALDERSDPGMGKSLDPEFRAEYMRCYMDCADYLRPKGNELGLSSEAFVAFWMMPGLPWS